MSALHLSLAIGGTWLTATLTRTDGWLRRSRHVTHFSRHPLDTAQRGLPDTLASLAAQLEAEGVRLQGASLEVELGMAHARVGLMHLADGTAARLDRKTLDSYVEGWMQQVLHLQPSEQVTRWQVLRDPRHVLASFVDKRVYLDLLAFSDEQGMVFRSCIPAVLRPVRAARAAGAGTVMWTEGSGAARDGSVQLLRLEQGQLRASWRGWVPPSPAPDGTDPALDAALRRFRASLGSTGEDPVVRSHWPALVEAA